MCFVPWAKQSSETPAKPTSKKLPSAASIAAREGIKADNKITKAVNDAISFLPEIMATKKLDLADRVIQGLAVRRWGSHWRTSVLFAILAEVGDSVTDSGKSCSVFL